MVLADVTPGGPAAEAGVRVGDLVLSLDGKPMENARQLDVNVSGRRIGEQVRLEVLRGEKTLTFPVSVVERQDDPGRFTTLVSPDRNLVPKLGILGLDLDSKLVHWMTPHPRGTEGVVVAVSTSGSLRREELFFPGDLIYAINGTPVKDLASLRRLVEPLRVGDASLRHREVSIELAREALGDKLRLEADDATVKARSLPSIDKVQDIVARRWGVTPEGLRSKARIKSLTVPRQIAMYLAREMLQMQLVEIGQSFGGRDHSTVIHSVEKVQKQLQRDRVFRERVESARQELLAS